jgi:tetratricopeptide (TPR) repeat protein
MPLSKEILHSSEMEEVLKNLQSRLDNNDGLMPGQLEEEDITLLYELAYNLYSANDFSKASEIFQRLVIAKPFEALFWQGFGSCQHMQNKYQEALTPWSMWCLIDDENPFPHFYAAESLFSLNEISEGFKALTASENRDEKGVLKDKIEGLRLAWRAHVQN